MKDYLILLTDGTPLSFERIKMAWSSLPDEDKLFLADFYFSQPYSKMPWPFIGQRKLEITNLMLGDGNSFVRYLVARTIDCPNYKNPNEINYSLYLEELSLWNKTQNDNVLFVRYAYKDSINLTSNSYCDELKNPETFWNRPHVERLLLVRNLYDQASDMATALLYAIEDLKTNDSNSKIPINLIGEVLLQYLKGRKVDTGTESLWKCFSKLPTDIAYIFLRNLPVPKYLPESAWNSMTEEQRELINRSSNS